MACRSRLLCQTARILCACTLWELDLIPSPCSWLSPCLHSLVPSYAAIDSFPCPNYTLSSCLFKAHQWLSSAYRIKFSLHSTDPSMPHILKGPEIPSPSHHSLYKYEYFCIFFSLYLLFCCCCLAVKSCPVICNPIDCSVPSSRILEWVDISFSKRFSWPKNWTLDLLLGRWICNYWTTTPISFRIKMKFQLLHEASLLVPPLYSSLMIFIFIYFFATFSMVFYVLIRMKFPQN